MHCAQETTTTAPARARAPRASRPGTLALCAAALAACLAACTSGLGGAAVEDESEVALSSAETGLGIDFGFELSGSTPDGIAITAASLPTATEGVTREVLFVAFVTDTPADDAGEAALVRDQTPPADDNGGFDVFVMAIEDELIDTGPTGSQPAAFSRALVNTFRHDRCQNCHAVAQTVTPPGEPDVFPGDHPGGPPPIHDENCRDCHNSELVPSLAGTVWFAPQGEEFELRGRTTEELSARAHAAGFDVEDHLLVDGRVRWAIESARVPQIGNGATGIAGTSSMWNGTGRDRGAVPVSYASFLAQIRAWRDGGFQATAAGSIRDLVLVSGRVSGASVQAGDGASFAPSLTWVPNPDFEPSDAGAGSALAGSLRIAFASDAGDLTAETSAQRDVFLTRVELHVGFDPSTGAALEGSLDLRARPDQTQLVSESAAGGSGGNGDSDLPSIDLTGTRIAFQSSATNLVSGFASGAGGGSDVFLRDLGSDDLLLVSGAGGSATQGGAGVSSSVSLSPVGGVLAFASTADDLVADDSNGEQDIFHARWSGSEFGALERDSVDSAGAQASGGSCRAPSAYYDAELARTTVVFESDKTDLSAEDSGAQRQIFVREAGETILLSQLRSGSAAEVGNGASMGAHISPTGNSVIFESLADNLDAVQRSDDNEVSDVFLSDLANWRSTGRLESRRLSLDSNFGDANGASGTALITAPIEADSTFGRTSLSLFQSAATNVGTSDSSALVCVFLDTEGVVGGTDFSAQPTEGYFPLEVSFTSLATGDIVRQRWDFGDPDGEQNRLDGAEVTHTYEAAGTYTVSLTVRRRNAIGSGTTDEVEEKVELIVVETPPIVPAFTGTPTSGDIPFAVTFTNESTGVPDGTLFQWDFGDGGSSNEALEATHTYTTEGDFDVSLELSPPGLDVVSLTKEAYISAIQPITAAFSATPNPVPAGVPVHFENESLGDLDQVTAFEWYSVDEDLVFSTAQAPADYTFATPGDYDVRLTLTFPDGTSQVTDSVSVLEAADAFFSFSPDPGITDEAIQFTASPVGGGITYLWDFGDGGSSTAQAPQHTYSAASSGAGYSVLLTVSGTVGTPTLARNVVVVDPSVADFDFTVNAAGRTGHRVDFVDRSTGTGLDSWSWDFGDGATSTLQNPSHTYAVADSYTVVLEVDGDSGFASDSQTVAITPISFAARIHPIFQAAINCHGCHTPGVNLTFAFDGSTPAMTLYDSLVDISAMGSCCTDEIPVPKRVDSVLGSEASLLVQVIDPGITACNGIAACGAGAEMNTGFANISSNNLELIRIWINDGAQP